MSNGESIDREAPLTLQAAAERAFPDGTMTVRTLRAERDRGRLDTWIIGKREYTTLAAIAKMIELCRSKPRAASRDRIGSASGPFDITKTRPGPDSGLRSLERLRERLDQKKQAKGARPSGLSSTMGASSAQAATLESVRRQKERLKRDKEAKGRRRTK